jgi:acetyl esterase
MPPVDIASPLHGLFPALAALLAPPRFAARAPTLAGLAYAERRGRGVAPLADVYLPDAGGPRPSVVLVHGGAFLIGSRRMKPVRFLATRLAEAGFAVLAIDYRLAFRGGRLAEALEDVASAVGFWRSRAGEFALDPRRISIAGLSAGAALALLHAADAPEIHRVVSIFGPTDFAATGRLARRLLLGTADPAACAARSPAALCRMPAPILVIHGDADVMVPVAHAHRLIDARRAGGLPVESLILPGEPHGFLNDARRPAAARAVEEIVRFLRG